MQTIGVFGEEVLLWIAALRQSQRRPPPDHVHRQANFLLDEAKQSKEAQQLPVVAVDDGLFVIAALLDEVAMALPDLRPYWSQAPLQATRWGTNNAGVEVFERLGRVRQGPKSVLSTYAVALGLGLSGRYGLPGADRYQLAQLRRQIGLELGVDPDRDWKVGVLQPARPDTGPSSLLPKEPWWRTIGFARAIAFGALAVALGSLVLVLVEKLG